MPPERDLSGAWVDAATGLTDAHIKGIHLRLPGHGLTGPTLEIFAYDEAAEAEAPRINRPGLAHVAFAVDAVPAAVAAVLAAGGGLVGEVVDTAIPGVGQLCFAYATDLRGQHHRATTLGVAPSRPICRKMAITVARIVYNSNRLLRQLLYKGDEP